LAAHYFIFDASLGNEWLKPFDDRRKIDLFVSKLLEALLIKFLIEQLNLQ
jgi:hypothetical protein